MSDQTPPPRRPRRPITLPLASIQLQQRTIPPLYVGHMVFMPYRDPMEGVTEEQLRMLANVRFTAGLPPPPPPPPDLSKPEN